MFAISNKAIIYAKILIFYSFYSIFKKKLSFGPPIYASCAKDRSHKLQNILFLHWKGNNFKTNKYLIGFHTIRDYLVFVSDIQIENLHKMYRLEG